MLVKEEKATTKFEAGGDCDSVLIEGGGGGYWNEDVPLTSCFNPKTMLTFATVSIYFSQLLMKGKPNAYLHDSGELFWSLQSLSAIKCAVFDAQTLFLHLNQMLAK